MEKFPKDYNMSCKHFRSRDMSVDDYVYGCMILGIEVNDYDFRCQYVKCPLPHDSEQSNCESRGDNMTNRKTHSSDAKKSFFDIVCGGNVMTPYVISYCYSKAGKYAVEVAHGKFMEADIYGVTVADLEKGTHRNDLSKSFSTEEEAWNYVSTL